MDVVRDIARTSIEASFCNPDLRRQLLAAVNAWTP
jgi:hypothetical protein